MRNKYQLRRSRKLNWLINSPFLNWLPLILSIAALAVSVWSTVISNNTTIRTELGIKKTELYSRYMTASKSLFLSMSDTKGCIGSLAAAHTVDTTPEKKDGLPCQEPLDRLTKASLEYDESYSSMLLAAPINVVESANDISKVVGFDINEGKLPVLNTSRLTEIVNSAPEDFRVRFSQKYVSFRKTAQSDIDL